MATLIVKLKQHTPIIHFQHYQDGATLRASELKPKLDKFLLKYFVKEKIDYKKWLIGNGQHPALNYKVKIYYENNNNIWKSFIEQPKTDNGNYRFRINKKDNRKITLTYSYPLFFGNMGKNYEEEETIKEFIYSEKPIFVKFISFDKTLIDKIEKNLPDFFALENFGSRQNKGFGSFYISMNDSIYKEINEDLFDYNFEIKVGKTGKTDENEYREKFINIFNQLDLFYSALRAGKNLKDRNGNTRFYFKSLLFLYFKNKNIQWEKSIIKQEFFSNEFYRQIKKYPYSDVLKYDSKNKKLIKDLLGLSTKEEWMYYKSNIEKIEAKNVNGEWVKKEKNTDDMIERFKSPIFFKVINIGNGNYRVFIKLSEEISIKGKWFIIEESNSGKKFPLQIPDDFDLKDFFSFILNKNNFDITRHVDTNFQCEKEYTILKNIFEQLQQKYGTK